MYPSPQKIYFTIPRVQTHSHSNKAKQSETVENKN